MSALRRQPTTPPLGRARAVGGGRHKLPSLQPLRPQKPRSPLWRLPSPLALFVTATVLSVGALFLAGDLAEELGLGLFGAPSFTGPYTGVYLPGYVREGHRGFLALSPAVDACAVDPRCGGVTRELVDHDTKLRVDRYTLRTGRAFRPSSTGEESWLKQRSVLLDHAFWVCVAVLIGWQLYRRATRRPPRRRGWHVPETSWFSRPPPRARTQLHRVACGACHTLLAIEGRPVTAAGGNSCGQSVVPPAPSGAADPSVVEVAAGGCHSLALLRGGFVTSFGNGDSGQTKVPDSRGRRVASVSAGDCHSVCVYEDGACAAFGRDTEGQCRIPDLRSARVVGAACGGCHTLLWLDDGGVVAFGDNSCGQCESPLLGGRRVACAAAGGLHSVLVFEDGGVVAFGDDAFGQCSPPRQFIAGSRVIAAAAGGCHSVLLLEDGTVVAFGNNDSGQCTIPPLRGKAVVDVGAGDGHTVLLLEDDTAVAVGRNDEKQCSGVRKL